MASDGSKDGGAERGRSRGSGARAWAARVKARRRAWLAFGLAAGFCAGLFVPSLLQAIDRPIFTTVDALLLEPRLLLPVAVVAGVVAMAVVWGLTQWHLRGYSGEHGGKEYFELTNDTLKTWAQLVGGIGIAITLLFTWLQLQTARQEMQTTQRQLSVSERQQINERFTRAIELLAARSDGAGGSPSAPNLESRLGAIYALESIAQDAPSHFGSVMEVMAGYVREHAAWNPQRPAASPRSDVLAAVLVIGRNPPSSPRAGRMIDLRKVDLRLIDMAQGHIKRRSASGETEMQRETGTGDIDRPSPPVRFVWVDLSDAHLDGADLSGVWFEDSLLVNASLRDARLGGAHFPGTDLLGADLTDAVIDRFVHFEGAGLYDVDLTAKQVARICIDADTSFSPNFGPPRPTPYTPCPPQTERDATPPPMLPPE